ncbi:flagellar biosynthesis anti-sigma factor FlgM [Bacteriovoracaceae bacterium]|nr:flagellar biosynthesis anti-sigma factor FlgM [Bacteriovoracaceae bacterium]
MSSIDTRPPFFPNKRRFGIQNEGIESDLKIKSNTPDRAQALKNISKENANVTINDKVKDFAKIKSTVDQAPTIDNSDKIAKLKAQIDAGTYEVDYEGLADKIINEEMTGL